MDHPALVITGRQGHHLTAELRGGVMAGYLTAAAVQIETGDGPVRGRVAAFDADAETGLIDPAKTIEREAGLLARWWFPAASLGIKDGILRARACDDLAGVAAALAALDRAAAAGMHHFSVLLTRAEEVGLIGAIGACEMRTLPMDAWVLSIECSRAAADAPLGAGPVVRVGDASSVFSDSLTNQVANLARKTGITHQRKLMAGGTCEATAFAALGYQATGLCLPLGNYHNMVDIDGVQAGKRRARLAPEEISLSDFDGLVDLLVALAARIDREKNPLPQRLRGLYRERKRVLE
jgi:endoglucanase